MKDIVLLELAERWDRESITPECQDGSKEAERGNILDQGNREGKKQCANTLRELIKMIGAI